MNRPSPYPLPRFGRGRGWPKAGRGGFGTVYGPNAGHKSRGDFPRTFSTFLPSLFSTLLPRRCVVRRRICERLWCFRRAELQADFSATLVTRRRDVSTV